MFRLLLISFLACLLVGPGFAEEKTVKGWGTVVDPGGDCKITEDKGKLTITVPKTHHDLTYTENFTKLNAPRILQEVKGDFVLQVKVHTFALPEANTSSSGQVSFISSGLLVWKDDKNFIRLERAAEGSSPAPFIWLERFQDGKAVTQQGKPVSEKDINLRVKRSGNKLTFSISEGGNWEDIHTEEVELPQKLQVGVLAINTTTKVFPAKFEGLKLSAK
jgi:regulation of enolase protein 1 (concanavalin A-like superfamily)